MNKYVSIILVFASLLNSCSSNKNDLEELNLKGKIWKLKETTYKGEEKLGKYQIGDKRYYGHQLYIFNEEGNLLGFSVLGVSNLGSEKPLVAELISNLKT